MRTRKQLPVRRRLKNKRRKRTAGRKKYKYKGGVKDKKLDDVKFECVDLNAQEDYPKLEKTHLLIDDILFQRSLTGQKPVLVGTGHLTTNKKVKIAVKLCPSYSYLQDRYEALRYESCVYDKIKELHMCNAVKKIYTVTIKGFDKMFSSKNPYFTPEALEVIKQIYTIVYPKKADDVDDEQIDYFLMFTIMSGTMSLEDAFQSELIDTDKHLKAIIFQVAFSLCKLHKAGIQHNDLHFGNILIDTNAMGEIKYTAGLPLSKGSTKIKDVTFVVPINNCKILLYDWDLGLADCGKNEFLEGDLCDNYGVCNDLNIKFDFYTFMRGFDQHMSNRFNRDFNKFRQEMFKTKLHEKYEMRMCNSNTGDEKIHCLPFAEGEPAEVMTPYDALQNKYFDDFNPAEKGEYYG